MKNKWVSSESRFVDPSVWDQCVVPGLLPDTSGSLFIGLDASVKHDSTAIACVRYDRFTDNLILADHHIWQPSPGAPMDESTVEFYLRRLQGYNTRIEKVLCDPFQLHRTVIYDPAKCRRAYRAVPAATAQLTLATETLYSRLTERRISFYPADDLRQHVINAASIETSRGIRLSKEKQTLKIDGAVALSFAVVAAEQGGKPFDLNQPVQPIQVDRTPWDPRAWWSY